MNRMTYDISIDLERRQSPHAGHPESAADAAPLLYDGLQDGGLPGPIPLARAGRVSLDRGQEVVHLYMAVGWWDGVERCVDPVGN